jgi:hypothetical protein
MPQASAIEAMVPRWARIEAIAFSAVGFPFIFGPYHAGLENVKGRLDDRSRLGYYLRWRQISRSTRSHPMKPGLTLQELAAEITRRAAAAVRDEIEATVAKEGEPS